MTVYAWLIEAKPSVSTTPTYWGIDSDGEWEFVLDHNKAIRFSRKEDADAFIRYYGWTEVTAVEHGWG